jgi:hypothetical protein
MRLENLKCAALFMAVAVYIAVISFGRQLHLGVSPVFFFKVKKTSQFFEE